MAVRQAQPDPSPAVRYGLPALGLAVLGVLGFRTIGHTSVWTHLSTGRWVASEGIPRTDPFSFATAEGASWIAETWLYDLVLFLLWKGGPALATLVHVAAVLGAFALLLPMARKLSGITAILFGMLLSAWLMAPVFEVRPAVLVLPLPALFIFLLSTPRSAPLRWGGVLAGQLLWTNCSATFAVGPLICAAFAAEATQRGRRPAADPADPVPAGTPARTLWMLTGGALLCTLLNPYGPLVYRKIAWVLTDPAAGFAREWISPFSMLFQSELAKHLSTLAMAIGAAGLLLYREKLPTAMTMIAVGCAAVTVITGQNLELFSVLAFPFFSLSVQSIGRFLDENLGRALGGRRQVTGPASTALGVVLALGSMAVAGTSQYYRSVGSASAFGLGVNEDLVPKEAGALLAKPGFPERALNLVMDGGYLRWAHPERKICFDHRTGLYHAADLRELLAGLGGDPEAYQALLAKWEPQAIILNATWPGGAGALPFLLQTGDWTLAYFDGTTPVLLRAGVPELASLARDRDAQQHGLDVLEAERARYRKQIEGPLGAPVSARLVGAGSTFYSLQRFRDAAAAFDLLLGNTPGMGSIWLQLGISQLQLGQVEEAVAALEKARDRAGHSASCWLWLSRAYAQAGRDTDASRAFTRGADLNPEEASRFGNPVEE